VTSGRRCPTTDLGTGRRQALLQEVGTRCTPLISLDPLIGSPVDLSFRTITLTQR
jgi:hypothetical protein